MRKLIQAQGESGKADMSGKWKAGGGRELSTFHLLPSTSARPSRRAFTLIEGFGVLASRIGSMRTKASSVIGLKPFFDRRGAEGAENDNQTEELWGARIDGTVRAPQILSV